MDTPKNNQVSLGSSVLILFNSKKAEYEIVDSSETDPEQNKISNVCPLGRALIGAEAGESRTFTVGDTEKTVKILDVN